MANAPLSILLLNQTWFREELREMGHEVLAASYSADECDLQYRFGSSIELLLRRLPRSFTPDRIVYHDNSGPVSIHGLEHVPIPSVFYSVDTHHHAHWQKYFAACFDLVLGAQKPYLAELAESGTRAEWFPLWSPVFVEPDPVKSVDVAFRGALNPKLNPARTKFFHALAERVEIDLHSGPYVDLFKKTRIVVNHAVKDDLNFRVFEVLMCGPLLLTPDDSAGLCDLFTPGVDLITYRPNDVDDAAEKIHYYLSHEEERAAIATAGHARAVQYHSGRVRAKEFEAYLQELTVTSRSKRDCGAAVATLTSSRLSARISELVGNELLLTAATSFLHCLEHGGDIDGGFLSAALYCVFRLRVKGFAETACELVCSLHRRFPEENVVNVLYLDALLREERKEEAEQFAQDVSSEPQILLANCECALAKIQEEILSAVEQHCKDLDPENPA